MGHDDASYTYVMFDIVLYCIVYRINVYVWMSNFLFILIAFLHVYTVCSIIVCFGMFICYTLCTLQKEEIKNIYLISIVHQKRVLRMPVVRRC